MLDSVVGLIVDHLKAGDKLRLTGLGILEVKDRPARAGRNPATGEAVQIAASRKIALRPAKAQGSNLNGSDETTKPGRDTKDEG